MWTGMSEMTRCVCCCFTALSQLQVDEWRKNGHGRFVKPSQSLLDQLGFTATHEALTFRQNNLGTANIGQASTSTHWVAGNSNCSSTLALQLTVQLELIRSLGVGMGGGAWLARQVNLVILWCACWCQLLVVIVT